MHRTPTPTSPTPRKAPPSRPNLRRRNRRRRNWNQTIQRYCGVIFVLEMAILVFFNPYFQVTKVQINGVHDLSVQQVFQEARVPAHTNIFWMAMHTHFGARLDRDPVIDHVRVSIFLPHTLVLNVTERTPFAALQETDASGSTDYWLLDRKGVPFLKQLSPPAGVPVVAWQGGPSPVLALGKPIYDPRLSAAYSLAELLPTAPSLNVSRIEVDQNANLCLNNSDGLVVKLGQPEALGRKLEMAQVALNANNGQLAQIASCLDFSSPQQPVYVPRGSAATLIAVAGTKKDSRPDVNDQ